LLLLGCNFLVPEVTAELIFDGLFFRFSKISLFFQNAKKKANLEKGGRGTPPDRGGGGQVHPIIK
jgi:hypothetical protein